MRLVHPLSSKQNKTAQSYETVLDQDVLVKGQKVLTRGSRVVGIFVEVKRSGRVKGKAKMSLALSTLYVGKQPLPIQTEPVKLEAEGSKRRDARRIGGATGLGALIGAVADGGEGAAKGAAIGAGVGVAGTMIRRGKEVELSAEQLMSFRLKTPIELSVM